MIEQPRNGGIQSSTEGRRNKTGKKEKENKKLQKGKRRQRNVP